MDAVGSVDGNGGLDLVRVTGKEEGERGAQGGTDHPHATRLHVGLGGEPVGGFYEIVQLNGLFRTDCLRKILVAEIGEGKGCEAFGGQQGGPVLH